MHCNPKQLCTLVLAFLQPVTIHHHHQLLFHVVQPGRGPHHQEVSLVCIKFESVCLHPITELPTVTAQLIANIYYLLSSCSECAAISIAINILSDECREVIKEN